MLEFELDIVQRELDQGSAVYLAYCQGGAGYCAANNPKQDQKFEQSKCVTCKSRVRAGIRWLDDSVGDLVTLEYENLNLQQKNRIRELKSAIRDEGQSLGHIQKNTSEQEEICWLSALSGMNTDLKTSDVDLSRRRLKFSLLLSEALSSAASMEYHLDTIQPDMVLIYNGRMPRYGPALDVLRRSNTPHTVYEYPGSGHRDYIFSQDFKPHDLDDFSSRNKKLFESLTQAEQEPLLKKAEGWLAKRGQRILDGRQAIALGESLAKISTGEMPSGWEMAEPRVRVAVFPSSQYEFANVASHRGSMALRQAEVIRDTIIAFPAFHFFVRIHPGQPESDQPFLANLILLANLENCTIMESDSKVDSYALGAAAEISLTFGSTIGVELAYQGKSVIECGSPRFSLFGATGAVYSTNELHNSLSSMTIAGRSSQGDAKLREAALRAVASSYSSARSPVYVEKESFFAATMKRGNEHTEIAPSRGAVALSSALSFVENPARLRRLADPVYRKFVQTNLGKKIVAARGESRK